MARFHLSAHSTVALAGRDDGETPQRGGIEAYGTIRDTAGLYTVVAAAKLLLPVDTTFCRVVAVEGAVYCRSGTAAGDDIAVPAGFLITEGSALPVAVTPGHTHLLVIAAEPTTDTATDLNA